MQGEVVDLAEAHVHVVREAVRSAVHEGTTASAPGICHNMAIAGMADGCRLSVALEQLLPSDEAQVAGLDGEVGCKHARADLAAVGAVADEAHPDPFTADGLMCERDELVKAEGMRSELTKAYCTPPQKQVLVVSPSPSWIV